MRIAENLIGLVVSMMLFACNPGDGPGIILDIRNVVNKTPEQVVEILGEPDTTYTERILGKEIYCQKYYRNNIEIQYPESLSTDVVVYGPHGLPFTQSGLKAFDLSYQKQHPSQYEKETLMRWYDFENFEAISFYDVQKDSVGRIKNYTIFFKAKSL
jgi:hypothetical protein